ncbi:ABC transporter permease [Zafaria sp. Z1313]|uniref:ABC transporter permease n=1 Tax=Zafaria sp. Z1313 TaxID=3423202 RepID=UPI003D302EB7
MSEAAATRMDCVHRPGPRSWAVLVACEAKMVARDTAGLIVPLGLPLLILVMSAGSAGEVVFENGLTALDLFVLPLVVVLVIASIGIINMPSFLAYYRRTGILRRLSVTPASPAMVLVAQAVVSVAQAVLGMALAFGVALLALGANPPVRPLAALGVVALSMAALYAVGMIVAALAPTPNSAVAIGLVLFLALGALGGLFGGSHTLPEGVAAVGEWLPFGAGVQALSAAWSGAAVELQHLAALGLAVIAGGVIAAVAFRWD